MDQQAALKFFELSSLPDGELLGELRRKRRFDLEEAILVAPTESLKRKYRDELSELETAYQVLFGDDRSQPAGMNVTRVRMRAGGKLHYRGEAGSGPAARPGVVPGDVLSGRFEIQHLLGAGALGATFEALDRSTGRRVAVKVFLPSLFTSPEVVSRFDEWAKKIVQVVHTSSVRVTDVMQDGDFRFLVSEFVEGKVLADWMKERRGMPISFAECSAMLKSISGPLQYLHDQGITHGVVKPQNIFLLEDGGIKLADGGQGSFLSADELQKAAILSKTNQYLAPEQRDRGDNKPPIDQYSLGMIAYELVSGADASSGKLSALKKLRADTPDNFAGAIDKSLEPEASQRFATISDFIAALGEREAAVVKDPPVSPPTATTVDSTGIDMSQPINEPPRVGSGMGNAALIFGGIAIVLLGVVLLGIRFLGGGSDGSTQSVADSALVQQVSTAWAALQKKKEGISSGLLERFVPANDFKKLEGEVAQSHDYSDRQLQEILVRITEFSNRAEDASVQPRLDVGLGLLKQGDKEGALREFRGALEVAPQSSMAHMNLAFALIASDKPLEAISELEIAVKTDPKNLRAHMALGKIFKSRGRIAEASQHFRKVVELDPDNSDAKRLLQELEY